MSDSKINKFDGEGNEIIGTLDVVKIEHPEGSPRPYHLEILADEKISGELVKYGSEVLGHLDLFTVGIRGAILEALAREKGI